MLARFVPSFLWSSLCGLLHALDWKLGSEVFEEGDNIHGVVSVTGRKGWTTISLAVEVVVARRPWGNRSWGRI
jgi:hypothetical protein